MAGKCPVPGFYDFKEVVRGYVLERLETITIELDCPPRIKISEHFIAFLIGHSVDETVAVDIAARQERLLIDEIDKQINRWVQQGVTPPFSRISDDNDALVTWQHKKFEEYTGEPPLDKNFFEIYSWLGRLKEKDFHLPCLCYLKSLGCNPIYFTDGKGDEGIDYIGMIASGPMRSTAIFVQAKSSPNSFGTSEVLQEYAKYSGLPRTEKYIQYLNALGVSKSNAGAAYVYIIVSNGDIKHGAVSFSYKVGALLRSRRQLALALASKYSYSQLLQLAEAVPVPDFPDLTRNLSSLLIV